MIRVKGVDKEEREEENSLCRNGFRLRQTALNRALLGAAKPVSAGHVMIKPPWGLSPHHIGWSSGRLFRLG